MSNYISASYCSKFAQNLSDNSLLIVSKIVENNGEVSTKLISLEQTQDEILHKEMHDLMLRVKKDYGQAILRLAEE